MFTRYSFTGIPVIIAAKQLSLKACVFPSYTECLSEVFQLPVFQPNTNWKIPITGLSSQSKHHCAKFTVGYQMLFIKAEEAC